MVDGAPWWEAVEPVATARPDSAAELVSVLDQLARIACDWSELLENFRHATHRFGGPGAAASYDMACRRFEQAFIELEIARHNARAAGYGEPA